MKILFNHVQIKPNENTDVIKLGDSNINIVTMFEEFQHLPTTGTVIGLPEKLCYDVRDHTNRTLEWDTDMELQIGDTVIFHYLAVKRTKKELPVMPDYDGVLIRYDQLFLAIRGSQVIPLNGTVIVSPDVIETKSIIEVPDSIKYKVSETSGTVRFIGKPVRAYLRGPQDLPYELEDLKVGDRVIFNKADSIPLQQDLHRTFKDRLYRMRHHDIIGIKEEAA